MINCHIQKTKVNKRFVEVTEKYLKIGEHLNIFFLKLGFTPCKAEQLQGMELQEKETQKDSGIHEICLERTCS